MRNYIYETYAIDDKGWGACRDGLWGNYVALEDRLFATAREAWAVADEIMGAGCWDVTDDDGERRDETPVIGVRRRCVYEWLWAEDVDDVAARVIQLHGGPIRLARMPASVGRWLIDYFGTGSREWAAESNALRGASSATHTAALASGVLHARAEEVREMFRARGVDLA